MSLGALVFMLLAWAAVLGLTTWCVAKLLRDHPTREHAPPPGTTPTP